MRHNIFSPPLSRLIWLSAPTRWTTNLFRTLVSVYALKLMLDIDVTIRLNIHRFLFCYFFNWNVNGTQPYRYGRSENIFENKSRPFRISEETEQPLIVTVGFGCFLSNNKYKGKLKWHWCYHVSMIHSLPGRKYNSFQNLCLEWKCPKFDYGLAWLSLIYIKSA